MKILLKTAQFLGVAPLVVGITIFIAWLFFRADVLMLAGAITIYAGVFSITVGTVFLIIYLWQASRSHTVSRRHLTWQTIAVLTLYLSNFVAAGGVFYGAIMIETRYTVSIINQSNLPLESAHIEGGGVSIPIGDIAPGTTARRFFWIEHDGELVLTGIYDSSKIIKTIDEYVTGSMGGNTMVVVDATGVVKVEENLTSTTLPQ